MYFFDIYAFHLDFTKMSVCIVIVVFGSFELLFVVLTRYPVVTGIKSNPENVSRHNVVFV